MMKPFFFLISSVHPMLRASSQIEKAERQLSSELMVIEMWLDSSALWVSG